MDKAGINYLRAFVVAGAVSAGFAIAYLALGLDMFHKFSDLIDWLIILDILIIFLLVFKLIFRWISISTILDGVWIGFAIFCWSNIFTRNWFVDPIDTAKSSVVYLVIGLVIFLLGYFFRRKR